MDIITGAIFALAFMSGNVYVGTTLDEPVPACVSQPDVLVTWAGPDGGGYNFDATACEYQASPASFKVIK